MPVLHSVATSPTIPCILFHTNDYSIMHLTISLTTVDPSQQRKNTTCFMISYAHLSQLFFSLNLLVALQTHHIRPSSATKSFFFSPHLSISASAIAASPRSPALVGALTDELSKVWGGGKGGVRGSESLEDSSGTAVAGAAGEGGASGRGGVGGRDASFSASGGGEEA